MLYVSLTYLSAAQLEKPVGVAMVTAEGTVEKRHFFADPRERIKGGTHTRTKYVLSQCVFPFLGGLTLLLTYNKAK